MSTREEIAKNLFADSYNCAQSVVAAFCEEEWLDKNTALRLASGFGGGMRCGEVCGAVSGAVMIIGLKCGFYIPKDLEQKAYCNKKTYEFIEKFKAENGSVLCRDLLKINIQTPQDHTKPEVQQQHKIICPDKIASAVKILEAMDF